MFFLVIYDYELAEVIVYRGPRGPSFVDRTIEWASLEVNEIVRAWQQWDCYQSHNALLFVWTCWAREEERKEEEKLGPKSQELANSALTGSASQTPANWPAIEKKFSEAIKRWRSKMRDLCGTAYSAACKPSSKGNIWILEKVSGEVRRWDLAPPHLTWDWHALCVHNLTHGDDVAKLRISFSHIHMHTWCAHVNPIIFEVKKRNLWRSKKSYGSLKSPNLSPPESKYAIFPIIFDIQSWDLAHLWPNLMIKWRFMHQIKISKIT